MVFLLAAANDNQSLGGYRCLVLCIELVRRGHGTSLSVFKSLKHPRLLERAGIPSPRYSSCFTRPASGVPKLPRFFHDKDIFPKHLLHCCAGCSACEDHYKLMADSNPLLEQTAPCAFHRVIGSREPAAVGCDDRIGKTATTTLAKHLARSLFFWRRQHGAVAASLCSRRWRGYRSQSTNNEVAQLITVCGTQVE